MGLKLMGLVLAATVANAYSQAVNPTARPQFEVASVKLSTSGGPSSIATPTGRFIAENVSLRSLILTAYRVMGFQLAGGPGWIGSEKYNIEAETDAADDTDAMLPMLQALLEDRFGLRLHRETKDGPVYVLTVAKSGIRMHESDCIPFDPNDPHGDVAVAQPARGGACGIVDRRVNAANRSLDGIGMTMEDSRGPAFPGLAGHLSSYLDRPVIDKTGLTGLFDIHLHWTDQPSAGDPGRAPQSDDTMGPSIFTAVQEQLGLKLESGKGPVDYLMIDHVEGRAQTRLLSRQFPGSPFMDSHPVGAGPMYGLPTIRSDAPPLIAGNGIQGRS